MCPICGKYRELTRCVRRMRIAHPTPPRGGDICPIGTTFLGFGPTPHTGKTSHTPIQRLKPRRISRRAVGARPSRSRGRPRLRPSRRRERPALDGVLSAMSIHRPPPGAASGSRAPLVLATRWENVVSARREPAASAEADPGGSGASDCSPLPTPRSCATTSWARPPCPAPKGQTAADTTTGYHDGSIHLLEPGAAS